MEYIHALDRLDTPQHTHTYAFEHGIARARHLLMRLGGAPTATTRCVLVAGSKGKGSTVAMLSSVLAAAGYRVGAFTGPHLHTPLERFAIFGRGNASGLSEDFDLSGRPMLCLYDFIAYARRIQAIIESWDRPELGLPTRFEAFTAMAYRRFEEQATDIAVMEIGIGGRLDAVNLAEPMVSIITNISLEHTQMLGKTLPEIAHAKAGILRADGIGVIAPQREEVAGVICAEAQRIGSHLQFAQDCCRLDCVGARIGGGSDDGTNEGQSGQWVRVQYCERCAGLSEDGATTAPLFLPLLGRYQLENAAAVITAIQALKERGYAISPEAMRQGLAAVRWPGRFEVLRLDPIVIADGAHTPYSMQQLCASLRDYFPRRRIHFIIGTLRDKDARGIIQAAMATATAFTFTGMDVRRATSVEQLCEHWRSLAEGNDDAPRAAIAPDLDAALRQALRLAGPDGVICIAGSLHLVAEAECHSS